MKQRLVSGKAAVLVNDLQNRAAAYGESKSNEDGDRLETAKQKLLTYIAELEGKAEHRQEVADAARKGYNDAMGSHGAQGT